MNKKKLATSLALRPQSHIPYSTLQVMESSAPGSDSRTRSDGVDDTERRIRVKDLREMRRQWRNEAGDSESSKQEQMEIFQVRVYIFSSCTLEYSQTF